VREEADELALNRLMKAYAPDMDDVAFAEKLVKWDHAFGDPDALRAAVRALADLKDGAGKLIRLSDDAVEGAG